MEYFDPISMFIPEVFHLELVRFVEVSINSLKNPTNSGLPFDNWLLPRVIELTYTAWDLQPFAQDCGWDGPPFRWDEERRFLIRCELDAAYFHLYGIERDDVDYIMETFPIVKRKDEQKYGEYRTKRVILEIYDAMAEAGRGAAFPIPRFFAPVMKFLCPAFLLTIFSLWVLVNVFGISFSGGPAEFSTYVKDLFITPDPVAWMAIGLVVAFGAFVALLSSRAPAYAQLIEEDPER